MTIAHVVPEMDSTEVPHEIGDGSCWCQPFVENDVVRDISDGKDSRLVIHRRYMDGPARDPDDDRGWAIIRVGDDTLERLQ